ncbi:MAG TPA: TraR/DksA C4-type zinc finger protein [Puia sp.]|jgi:RNA polymerase-binding transcription factor DksA|nr:TraR/DksA C4-type zinc finger protein [Puia sp.]
MAIKKKPVKAVKKVQPKKVIKPATKKVVAKKAAPVKSVKKDSPKKNTPVVKKSAVSASKPANVKAVVPAKKAGTSPSVSKKQAVTGAPLKKTTSPVHPVKPSPVIHAPQVAKSVQPAVAKPVKTEDTKAVFKQQVKNTSPVMVKPEPKKPVTTPAKAIKVVIPDIKTKTVRKYEPEFTKSVLDTHQQEQTGPTMRYSDSELTEFRELITKKLDSAKKELAYLQGLITRRDEMGGDETDNRYMTMEDGSMSMEREQLSQMASRQITFIDHLEKAMMRIENKTYGICRVTGKLIDKARLKAVPHATLSIEAKQTMNK